MRLGRMRRVVVLVGLLATLCLPTVVMAVLAHSDLFGCDGCHEPHNAGNLPGVPLWNGNEPTATFTLSPMFTIPSPKLWKCRRTASGAGSRGGNGASMGRQRQWKMIEIPPANPATVTTTSAGRVHAPG